MSVEYLIKIKEELEHKNELIQEEIKHLEVNIKDFNSVNIDELNLYYEQNVELVNNNLNESINEIYKLKKQIIDEEIQAMRNELPNLDEKIELFQLLKNIPRVSKNVITFIDNQSYSDCIQFLDDSYDYCKLNSLTIDKNIELNNLRDYLYNAEIKDFKTKLNIIDYVFYKEDERIYNLVKDKFEFEYKNREFRIDYIKWFYNDFFVDLKSNRFSYCISNIIEQYDYFLFSEMKPIDISEEKLNTTFIDFLPYIMLHNVNIENFENKLVYLDTEIQKITEVCNKSTYIIEYFCEIMSEKELNYCLNFIYSKTVSYTDYEIESCILSVMKVTYNYVKEIWETKAHKYNNLFYKLDDISDSVTYFFTKAINRSAKYKKLSSVVRISHELSRILYTALLSLYTKIYEEFSRKNNHNKKSEEVSYIINSLYKTIVNLNNLTIESFEVSTIDANPKAINEILFEKDQSYIKFKKILLSFYEENYTKLKYILSNSFLVMTNHFKENSSKINMAEHVNLLKSLLQNYESFISFFHGRFESYRSESDSFLYFIIDVCIADILAEMTNFLQSTPMDSKGAGVLSEFISDLDEVIERYYENYDSNVYDSLKNLVTILTCKDENEFNEYLNLLGIKEYEWLRAQRVEFNPNLKF